MKLKAVVSAGDILDKATILEIKASRIEDARKVVNVIRELKELSPIVDKVLNSNSKLSKVKSELFKVNSKLWEIENSIRALEARKDFGKDFIALARSVYMNNDKRAELKNKINILSGSAVKEEKQYSKY